MVIKTCMDNRETEQEIVYQVLQEMQQYTKLQCERLEKQFQNEIQNGTQDFILYTGVTERKYYDLTEGSMFPMCREDLKEEQIELQHIIGLQNRSDSPNKGLPVKVADLFLELDSREIKLLLAKNQSFLGYIYTQNGEYPVTAVVRPNQKYQKILEHFKQIVFNQGLSVQTICAPYLNKFLEVYLTKIELPSSEKIDRIEIDFKEYKPYVKYHCFPVWNIEPVSAASSVCLVGNLDRVMYRHFISETGLKDGIYLVADETDLFEVNQTEEGLVITTELPAEKEWRLWRIVPKVSMTLPYPVFHSGRSGENANIVRTKQGVRQFVNSLLYQERMLLSGIEFPESHSLEGPVIYGDKAYLKPQDISTDRRLMLLRFRKQREDFLQTDVLAYLVRAVQHNYPEFCCCGVFDDKEI